VLIPRPETEELCSIIAAENPHFRFRDVSCLDIGTGSGCIAISLKKSFPYWSVTGVDISAEAAETARRNAERNNCDIRVEVLDITREASWSVLGRFDLVVSNPPYVTELEKSRMQPNVLHHEPAVALFVADHDPLLFYRTIADFCNRQMTRPGLLYLEINERFGKEVRDLLHEKGFTKARIIRDFHGKERFVSAEVTEPLHDTSYWYADKPG
jgi:release factor glutamine methyltransferase